METQMMFLTLCVIIAFGFCHYQLVNINESLKRIAKKKASQSEE